MTYEQHGEHSFGNQMREGFARGSEPEGHHQRMFEGGYGGSGWNVNIGFFPQGGAGFGQSEFSQGGPGFGQPEFLDCNEDMGCAGFGERGSRGRMHMGRRQFEGTERERLRHRMLRIRAELAEEAQFENMPAAYSNSLAGNPDYANFNGQAPAGPVDYAPAQPQYTGDQQPPPTVASQGDGTQGAPQNFADQNVVAPPSNGDGTTSDGTTPQIDPVLAQILQDAQQTMSTDGFNALLQQLQTAMASGQQTDVGSLLQTAVDNMQQAGVSTDDLTKLKTVANADLQNASAQSDQTTATTTAAADPSANLGNTGDGSWGPDTSTQPLANNGTGQNDATLANNGTGQNDATNASDPEISAVVLQIAQDAQGKMSDPGFQAFVAQLKDDLTTGGAQQLDDPSLMNRVLAELQKKGGVSQDDLTALQTTAQTDLNAAAQTAQAGNPSTTGATS